MVLTWVLSGVAAAEPLPERMETHWRLAASIEVEAVWGHVDVVREMAGRLAALPIDGFDPLLEQQLDALRFAAAEVVDSATTTEIARGVATIGEACGGCHQARGAGPPVRLRAWPPVVDTDDASMVEHQEAADWLWIGLVAPSDQAWRRGTRSLRRTPPNEDVEALAVRAQESLPGQRGAIVGELLVACAGCHSAANGASARDQLPSRQ